MTVKVIKLITGEEIISTVTDIEIEGREIIQVSQPAIIILMPNDDNPNQAQIGLAPWAPYANNQVAHIMPNAIAAIIDPKPELVTEYEKLYGSKIITPSREIVTPLAKK